jgi:TldD protein
MLDEAVIKRVLAEGLAAGGELSELFVEDKSSTVLRLDDSRVEDVSSGHERGAGIRVFAGERTSYAYTNVLTESSLLDAARAARAGLDGERGAVTADLTRPEAQPRHPVESPPEDAGTASKVAALQAADESARASGGEVRQVVATHMDTRQKVLIASSDGRIAEDDRTRVRFAVQVVAARGGEIATGFEAPGHSGGMELLERFPAAELGAKAAGKALRMLDARPSPAGQFPVVLGPGQGGVLIHEACGHGLEADTLVKKAASTPTGGARGLAPNASPSSTTAATSVLGGRSGSTTRAPRHSERFCSTGACWWDT